MKKMLLITASIIFMLGFFFNVFIVNENPGQFIGLAVLSIALAIE